MLLSEIIVINTCALVFALLAAVMIALIGGNLH